jgi:hypothetical protein
MSNLKIFPGPFSLLTIIFLVCSACATLQPRTVEDIQKGVVVAKAGFDIACQTGAVQPEICLLADGYYQEFKPLADALLLEMQKGNSDQAVYDNLVSIESQLKELADKNGIK